MSDTGAASRLSVLRDAFQTLLWPLPVVGVVVAVGLGVTVPMLDQQIDHAVPSRIGSYLFGGGAEAARTVLSAVGSSLITVTSLTFSLTVVTLQLASSQFSPRLLRTFSRDRFVHVTLAIFLGTYVYSLMVLRTVRNGETTATDVVPQIAVTFAVVLTLASVIALVLFLAHLAKQIRVETILDKVHHETTDTLHRVLEPRYVGLSAAELAPTPPPDATTMLIDESGFLVSVDENDLVEAAVDAGVIFLIEGFPGGSLVSDTPLGQRWGLESNTLSAAAQDKLHKRIADAVSVGPERTAAQDIAFGLRQLTDVANKALSPGINDPTTAVYALGHISGVLCEVLQFELGPRLLTDDQDRIRVVLGRPDFGDLLDGAIAQPRRFAASSPTVLDRIAQLLREVGWAAKRPNDQQAVREQVQRLEETIADGDLGTAEIVSLTAAVRGIHRALDDQW